MPSNIATYIESMACEAGHKEYLEQFEALATFLNEIDFLKSELELTQRALAEKCGMTTSKVSRLLTVQPNLTYEQMSALARGVGGELRITAFGDYTAVVPKDLHSTIVENAKKRKQDVQEYLQTALRDKIVSDAESALSKVWR